jgi:hypothetical protein
LASISAVIGGGVVGGSGIANRLTSGMVKTDVRAWGDSVHVDAAAHCLSR